jgi:NAD(P)-dependent dehydrogenase (short-subunit alcohol dehydrogenase family)
MLDVAQENQWAQAMETVVARYGRLDVLVNNAGITGLESGRPHDPEHASLEDWRKVMTINLDGVFLGCKYAIAAMRKDGGGGSIINMSSVAWIRGAPALPAYAAAKAAIVGFTNSLARLVGPDRIRVNAIAPGMVITERQRRLWFPDEQKITELRARQAVPDAVTPDDIARLALFLASDDSQRITRQCFQVDGGL